MATINKNKTIISFALVIGFFLMGFFLIHNSSYLTPSPLSLSRRGVGERSDDIQYVKIAGVNIKVDLALTQAEQTQGLSGRVSLNDNEGMLFVFDKSGRYPFWMKDMNFPIDMIWVGEDLRVVYIKENALPELYPKTYDPNANAKYVLEVVSGFSVKNNLKEGDIVEFTY